VTITLSSECRIVFLAASGVRGDDELRRVLAEPVDWDRVMALVMLNKAAAALDGALTRIAATNVPAAPREQLRRQRMVGDFHMLYLRGRLQETLVALHAGSVDVLLLKGAALGVSVYAAVTERPMADIDLLVRHSDRDAATAALLDVGWIADEDPSRVDFYREHHHMPLLVENHLEHADPYIRRVR
jgi:hypothetical protein